MITNASIQKFILASVCLLALASGQAQTADGTVVVSGQLNATTCTLAINDAFGNRVNNGVLATELETVAPPSGTITPGGFFGTLRQVAFALRNSTDTGPCVISGTPALWNLVLDLEANQVGTAGGKAFLTNQATTNAATNVGIVLFEPGGAQFTSILTGRGYGGTRLNSSNVGQAASSAFSMSFRYVTTSAVAPTPGIVSATVPFLIVYN